MEERFPTESFPFRFFTTVLGIIFVNTHRLHIGTNLGLGNTTYKEHLSELFYAQQDRCQHAAPLPRARRLGRTVVARAQTALPFRRRPVSVSALASPDPPRAAQGRPHLLHPGLGRGSSAEVRDLRRQGELLLLRVLERDGACRAAPGEAAHQKLEAAEVQHVLLHLDSSGRPGRDDALPRHRQVGHAAE